MYQKFDEWESLATESFRSMQQGKRFPHQNLAKAFTGCYQGIWSSMQLQAMGEPAGYDLEHKFTFLRNALGNFSGALVEFQPKEISKLQSDSAKRKDAIAKASELEQQGKLVEAEAAIRQYHLRQLGSVFYLNYSQFKEFENQVAPIHNRLLKRLSAERRSEYAQKAIPSMKQWETDAAEFDSECKEFVLQLKSSSTVNVGAIKDGDVSDVIDRIGQRWIQVARSIDRSYAIAAAFNLERPDQLHQQYFSQKSNLKSNVVATLKQVVSAACVSSSADSIPTQYPEVLQAIANIERRCHLGVAEQLSPELGELLNKNPNFALQVDHYNEATRQPMHWMSKYAKQSSDAVRRQFSPVAQVMTSREKPAEIELSPIYRPLSSSPQVLTVPSFSKPCHWIAGSASSLVGRSVSDQSNLRLSLQQPKTVTPNQAHQYSTITVDSTFDSERKSVEKSFMTSVEHPPLNLVAAQAFNSLLSNEFELVGGQVTKLTIEPSVCVLGEGDSLVQLDQLPLFKSDYDNARQLTWAYEIQPLWIQHQLFFVDLREGSK
ncbi:hypothetical protein LOC67_11090 [Stieleria sp. JC731]|nr:hypothetical protein [Stieleria sp. JC731]MCC9601092.1 hypothetical protein [Stieleria sp. JC731]